jgi:hypothetical protein
LASSLRIIRAVIGSPPQLQSNVRKPQAAA